MNRYETEILEQIEHEVFQEDAQFAQHIAGGPRLSTGYKVGLAVVAIAGIVLVMLFPLNLVLGLAGYVVLVVAGTSLLRRRPLKPADESPVEVFHRLTADLFRDTGAFVEAEFE